MVFSGDNTLLHKRKIKNCLLKCFEHQKPFISRAMVTVVCCCCFRFMGCLLWTMGHVGEKNLLWFSLRKNTIVLSVKVMLWELFLFNLFIWRAESDTEKDPILGLLPKYPCQLGLGPSSSWRLDVTSVYLSRSYIIVTHKTQRILNIPDYTSGSMVNVFTQALYFSFLTVN